MNWRDILVGAFAALVVTVLGGVGVYYFTREPPVAPPTELLEYEEPSPTLFQGEKTRLAFFPLRIANVGRAPANDVRIAVSLDSASKIVDSTVSLSSGLAGSHESSMPTPQTFIVTIPTLTPSETVRVSLLVDGSANPKAEISVKSQRSTGSVRSALVSDIASDNSRAAAREVANYLVPLALALQMLVLIGLRSRISVWLRRMVPAFRSLNNTAFLCLHQGLLDEAKGLLDAGIKSNGADCHMLANYGLCSA
jgi:hypothetical protein